MTSKLINSAGSPVWQDVIGREALRNPDVYTWTFNLDFQHVGDYVRRELYEAGLYTVHIGPGDSYEYDRVDYAKATSMDLTNALATPFALYRTYMAAAKMQDSEQTMHYVLHGTLYKFIDLVTLVRKGYEVDEHPDNLIIRSQPDDSPLQPYTWIEKNADGLWVHNPIKWAARSESIDRAQVLLDEGAAVAVSQSYVRQLKAFVGELNARILAPKDTGQPWETPGEAHQTRQDRQRMLVMTDGAQCPQMVVHADQVVIGSGPYEYQLTVDEGHRLTVHLLRTVEGGEMLFSSQIELAKVELRPTR